MPFSSRSTLDLLVLSLLLQIFLGSTALSWNPKTEWVTAEKARSLGIAFILPNGQIATKELNQFKAQVLQRQMEFRRNIETNEGLLKNKSPENVQRKIKNNKTIYFFGLILTWIQELENSARLTTAEKIGLARKILEVDMSLKSDIDPDNTIGHLVKHIKTFSEKLSVSKKSAPLGEAANLVDPRTGKVLSAAEVESLKRSGVDISKFDPPADNGVIQILTDINATSPTGRFSKGQNPVHKGVKLVYPKDNTFYFDEVRKRQSKPKLTVFVKQASGEKLEFKLKLASELHGEATASALGQALGIYSDLTRYVKNVKVILGTTSYEDFKRDWYSYYSKWDLDRLIKEKGKDASGNYIVFIDGLLEPDLDESTLMRVGPWYWGALDHQARREFRGLFLFNVWINNTDLKEGENNKLVLKKKPDGSHDFFYIQHDMGFSFGHFFREHPTDYSWNLVEKVTQDKVHFDFRNFQPNSGFEHVTWSDARWMVRKMAQLSRKQITEAVSLGQWPNQPPYNYQALIVEKLIARRNQLVRAFELEGDQSARGEKLSLMSENRMVETEAIKSKKYGVPGYSADFSPEIKSQLIDPVVKKVGELLKSGALNLVYGINKISIEPSWFGWDHGVISEVIINVNRTVVKNPTVGSLNDAYIVRDDFKIGARLGYGFVISGDVAHVRGFSLIYSAPTKEGALNGPRHTAEIMQHGYSQIHSKLPKGHILITETYLEGRGRIKLDGGPVSLGYELTASRFDLSRAVISRKNANKLVFIEDESLYTEIAQKIYTQLLILKIQHFRWSYQKGTVERNAYELSLEGTALVDGVLFENNFAEVKKRGTRRRMVSDFWKRESKINIFGVWQRKKEIRRDLVDLWTTAKNGEVSQGSSQLVVEMSQNQNWQIGMNGEEHSKQIHFSSEINNRHSSPTDPILKLTFLHFDKNVTEDELVQGYLPFIDGLTASQNFLNFTPGLHGVNKTWGELVVKTNLEIYEEGISTLLLADENHFNRILMANLGLAGISLSSVGGPSDAEGREQFVSFNGQSYPLSELLQATERFLKSWKKVKKANSLTEKIEALVVALYKAGDRTGDSFQPLLIRVLSQMIGENNIFMEAHISVPEDTENKLPGRLTPYNRSGTQRAFSQQREKLLFDMSESLNIYQSF